MQERGRKEASSFRVKTDKRYCSENESIVIKVKTFRLLPTSGAVGTAELEFK